MPQAVPLSESSAYKSIPGALPECWIICVTLIAATCLLRSCYKGKATNPTNPREHSVPRSSTNDVPYPHQAKVSKKSKIPIPPKFPLKARQPFDAFLILDVEATCQAGTDFNYPNEIIEFPVCLMKWRDRSDDNKAGQLETIDEFRSFVKPSWRPALSEFCKDLTGITQKQVDSAPPFPKVMEALRQFMVKHGLLDGKSGERLVRFCWCSDGPFDVRDFVVKQCFISKIPMPGWFRGDIVDVKTLVLEWLHATQLRTAKGSTVAQAWDGPRRRSLNIPAQLKSLELSGFQGKQHSGIDDSRNLARIVAELARRGVSLKPNTAIPPNKRWQWMGRHGQILGYFPT